ILRPYARTAALEDRAARLRARLVEEIGSRFDLLTGRVLPGPGNDPDFFAWTDGQALSALLSAPLPAPLAGRVRRDFDQLFSGQLMLSGVRLVELVEGKGFWR